MDDLELESDFEDVIDALEIASDDEDNRSEGGLSDSSSDGAPTVRPNDHYPVKEEIAINGLCFECPVYLQRYHWVTDVLRKNEVVKVMDVGCAEGSLFRFLKNLTSVRQINGLDIDDSCIHSSRFSMQPLPAECIDRRRTPLNMRLFRGSIAFPDRRFLDLDAVTAVEIIEHLHDETIVQMRMTIFGVMQPKLVLMTTPNADFNILFPDFKGTRHWDHKFEWTRAEFKRWCDAVCDMYPYRVEYAGIGEGPEGTEELGECSQAAIFRRTKERQPVDDAPFTTYDMVYNVDYPVDKRTDDERMHAWVYHRTTQAAHNKYDEEEHLNPSVTLELSFLLEHLVKYSDLALTQVEFKVSEEDMMKHLSTLEEVTISEDKKTLTYRVEYEDSDDEEEEAIVEQEASVATSVNVDEEEESWD